jgi:RNA polymerase sigma factor (sigma-70 family)
MNKNSEDLKRKRFEQYLPVIKNNINKRKAGWKIPTMDWEDVSQTLIIRIWSKFHLFSEEKGVFDHWINKIISNSLTNLMRDNFAKYNKPCNSGCVYNLGGSDCSFTKSQVQCAECPLYRKWIKKKQQQFNVATSLSLEEHSNETHKVSNDLTNIELSKTIIDDRIKEVLTRKEWEIYTMMFIEHQSYEYIGQKMNFKLIPSSHIPGYQEILRLKRKFIELSKEIILDEGLA